jgi:hypothetical protein
VPFWRRDKTDLSEARRARVEAEAALERAKSQRASIQVVSDQLKRLNNENHYADKIAHLIRGGEA